MMRRVLIATAALAAIVGILLMSPVPAAGQAPSSASKAAGGGKSWTAPHTPDGAPDLQGIWNTATITPLERPKGLGTKEFYTDEEYAKLTARARQGDVGEEAELGAARENELRYDISL